MKKTPQKNRKYPKGFTNKAGAIAGCRDVIQIIKRSKPQDDAFKISFKIQFRQWDEKKKRYV